MKGTKKWHQRPRGDEVIPTELKRMRLSVLLNPEPAEKRTNDPVRNNILFSSQPLSSPSILSPKSEDLVKPEPDENLLNLEPENKETTDCIKNNIISPSSASSSASSRHSVQKKLGDGVDPSSACLSEQHKEERIPSAVLYCNIVFTPRQPGKRKIKPNFVGFESDDEDDENSSNDEDFVPLEKYSLVAQALLDS